MKKILKNLFNKKEYEEGDMCAIFINNKVWVFYWILKIDVDKNKNCKIYSLRVFNVHTEKLAKKYPSSEFEYMISTKPLIGHFPIQEYFFLKYKPIVKGNIKPSKKDLNGYEIWKKDFDIGKAGYFTIDLIDAEASIYQTHNKITIQNN